MKYFSFDIEGGVEVTEAETREDAWEQLDDIFVKLILNEEEVIKMVKSILEEMPKLKRLLIF